MTYQYIVYADGACSGNPGPGGWAYEISNEQNLVLGGSDGSADTTNNIMELTGACAALERLFEEFADEPGQVFLRLDSQYVLDGLFKWLPGWKAKGWKTSAKKPVKNQELWQRLDAVNIKLVEARFILSPNWIKGHDGEPGNERVDKKAQERRDEYAKTPMSATLHSAAESLGIPIVDLPASRPDNTMLAGMPAMVQSPAAPAAAKDINSMQVELMRTILDCYGQGDYSVKKVIEEIRANAIALGCK